MQGMWAMIVASAAQQSVASGQAVSIDGFIAENDLETLLN
jgi:primosomal replication protein N